jgi:hypothetical protein
MTQGGPARKRADLTMRNSVLESLFWPGLIQSFARQDELSGTLRLNGLCQSQGGVAHFLLKGSIAIERLMARRIGLVIADIAVDLGRASRVFSQSRAIS